MTPLLKRPGHGLRSLILAALVPLVASCGIPETRTNGAADGPKIYAGFCATCHGQDGRKGEEKMQLTHCATQPDAAIQAVIANGRGRMPGWKTRLQPDEIAAVAAYVKQLSKAAAGRG